MKKCLIALTLISSLSVIGCEQTLPDKNRCKIVTSESFYHDVDKSSIVIEGDMLNFIDKGAYAVTVSKFNAEIICSI